MSDGNTPVLAEAEMRQLGFTDHRPEHWYFTRRVGSGETVNFTITKATGEYDELVMDEHFGQPAYYGSMKPQYRDEIQANIDRTLAELNAAGLTLAVDSSLYRTNKH